MPVIPYTGPFAQPELRHLLRRSLFGATPADMAHFAGMSLDQVIDELLTFTNDTTPPIKAYSYMGDPNGVDPDVPFGSTWTDVPTAQGLMPDPNVERRNSLGQWLTGLMIHQQRNLREKYTLFWHNHLVTQVTTVQLASPFYGYLQTLRTQCAGNFRQLIYDISIDTGMLIYLNGYLNIASAPDENYGRELMELFTLGEGTGYTEADVQTAARVLTGWTVQIQNGGNPIIPQTTYIPFNHDTGSKTFSAFFNNTVIAGQSGLNGGSTELNALLDMICAKDEVSLHLCRKLYRFFVHSEIDASVEADLIAPLAQLFRDNATAPDQLRIVLRALLTSDAFFSADVRACMVPSPADYVIGKLRQLNMPFPDASAFEAQYRLWGDVWDLMAYAGQQIGEPPNVAGWPAYYQYPQYDKIWMDSATYAVRKSIYEYITYTGLSTPALMVQPQSQNLVEQVDLIALTQQFPTPQDPNALISALCDMLFVVDVSQTVKNQLKINYLLFGQLNDDYWMSAYTTYVADPNTTDMAAQLVPTLLTLLLLDMQGAAEHHLM